MKIIILQGNDTVRSYERLTKFIDVAKSRNWEIIYDDLGVSQSLFGAEKLIIIRNIKLITQKNLNVLEKIDGNLVIYSETKVSTSITKILPKDTKTENFDLPKIIWSFLDNITIKGLHEVIKTEPLEFVFAMIAKRIKEIYWARIAPDSLPLQQWQLQKLKKQFNHVSDEKLKIIIEKLAQMDADSKTGQGDLLLSLDLLIVRDLQ